MTDIYEPPNVRRLPMDPHRGIRVPYFVAWVDGKPDFRVADKFQDAVRFRLCWLCGQPMGRFGTFVLGPMCMINRTTAEPPCHLDCAVWSVQMCPWMMRPHAKRRPKGMPEGHTPPAGAAILRNPGVTLLWTTRVWSMFNDGNGGKLFELGDPTGVQWWAEGRTATRAEVDESIRTGLPILLASAEAESPDAVAELEQRQRDNEQYLPTP